MASLWTPRIAFWGVGPSGPGYSNHWIRRWFGEGQGWSTGKRSLAFLLWLASCVPPGACLQELVGYSRGAVAAVRFARILARRGVWIQRLLALDPVVFVGDHLTVPDNVCQVLCFYQRHGARTPGLWGRLGKGVPLRRADGSSQGITNVELGCFPEGKPILHEEVPAYLWQISQGGKNPGGPLGFRDSNSPL
jgi:hypothetical protein